MCVKVFLSPHHPEALAATQLFILLPLRQVIVRSTLPLRLLSLCLLARPHLFLFRQLILKVLQVPIGSLVCWILTGRIIARVKSKVRRDRSSVIY